MSKTARRDGRTGVAAGRTEGGGAASSRRRLSWRDSSGKSSLRGLIALVLVVGGVYLGFKLIPVRANAYQFNDAIREQVTFAGSRRSTDERIQRELLAQARELGLPVQAGNISIRRPTNRYIIIEVDYTVTIEFIGGYTWDWHFSPRYEGPII